MNNKIKRPKIIVTLGPATNSFEKISIIKSKGIDFVRINMSHSNIEDLNYYIAQAKKADIPFIIDTEGNINSSDYISKISKNIVEMHNALSKRILICFSAPSK